MSLKLKEDDDTVVLSRKEFRRLEKAVHRANIAGDVADLFGEPIPKTLLSDYDIKEGENSLTRALQKKYLSRARNTRRCWNRVQQYLPELMQPGQPKKILEMSTAHGGMLEVLRHFGHDVMGNDYANMVSRGDDGNRALYRSVNDTGFSRDVDDYGVPLPSNGETLRDWPYRQIIESIDVPMSLFDAGQIPYPHQDKEFDYLLCFQAIEHYCHPRDWMKVVDEFCRITKESIIILLNPKLDWLQADDESYDSDFAQAKLALRNYDRNGFRCTSCHIQWGTVHGFKLTANPAG